MSAERLWLAVSVAALLVASVAVARTDVWLLPAVVAGPLVALAVAHRGRRSSELLLAEVSAERARIDRLHEEGEQLVARVSRELRGPLTPIRGFAAALARRGDQVDPAVRQRALEQIADRAVSMGRLVDDLLIATCRSDDGEPAGDVCDVLARGPIDVEEQVRRDLRSFTTAHPDRNFQVSVPTSVPRALGDPAALEQVLSALLSNACRYSPPSSPVTVHVGGAVPGTVQVAVTDRGPGIPSDERERVFERFHRLRRPTDPGGLGLGLYVARRLAEAMGGRITLDSYEGDGSTFTLSLPAVRHVEREAPEAVEALT